MERRAPCQDIILIQSYMCVCVCACCAVKKRTFGGERTTWLFPLSVCVCVILCLLDVCGCGLLRVSKDAWLSPAVRNYLFFFGLSVFLPETHDQTWCFFYLNNTCWLFSFILPESNILTSVPEIHFSQWGRFASETASKQCDKMIPIELHGCFWIFPTFVFRSNLKDCDTIWAFCYCSALKGILKLSVVTR